MNRAKRIDLAKTYLNKSQEFCSKIAFTDESKFNVFGSDGWLIVWHREGKDLNPKNTVKTVKHGGVSAVLWGCMSLFGFGYLVFLENTRDQYVYLNI